MEYRTVSGEDMQRLAADFARRLIPGKAATVVALSGDLGAGKTTFTQGLALMLGVVDTVQSPTFVLEKVYKLDGQPIDRAQGKKFTHLIHMDAYRLKGPHELRVLGWEEIVRESGNLIVLEWPERVEQVIPTDATHIRIDIEGDERRITINGAKEAKGDSESS